MMLPIDMIAAARVRTPRAIAAEGPGFALSYAELLDRADALAAGLQEIDVRPQSRVGICADNTIEHLIGLLATMAAEKIWIPLNPRDAKGELDAKIEATRPSILIADEACLDKFTPFPAARLILGKTRPTNAADTIAGIVERKRGLRPARSHLPLTAVQAIKFTGGSSGRPKGVEQPYRAWNTGAACMIHALGLTARDKYLIAAPLTHGTSCYVTPTLAQGGTMVFLDGPARPAKILDAFAERAVSTTFLPPTLIYMLIAEPDVRERLYPALRNLIYGGAPMPGPKVREAQDVFGRVIATNYGQTEAPQIITFMRPEDFDESNLAAAGRASLLTRVAIRDSNGRILPPGEDGEIVVAGDLVMNRYLDMPAQTAETLKDGWLHTGDLGALDERGFLYIKDRIRDVVISGGFNVYPSDVEAALVKHPAIYECVVFGVPDDKWGEAVTAAVQLRAGAQADEADIIAFAKEHVGSVKAPKRVVFYDSLPRSSVGKVQRREVRERESAKVARAAP